jgi:hypothetical protein
MADTERAPANADAPIEGTAVQWRTLGALALAELLEAISLAGGRR